MSYAPPVPTASAALIQAAVHLQASKYFLVAAFAMLVYDIAITLGDEVERIWKQPWTGATFLYAVNRYVTLFQRPIIVTAFTSPAWSRNLSACEHFVRFEGGSTLGLVATVASTVIMMLRVYAVWHRNRRVLIVLILFWVAQVAFSGMALGFSMRVPLPPILAGCILTGVNNLFSPFWIMPLITDSVVFGLTLWRTMRYSKATRSMPLLKLFVRDGALYFLCISSANLLNVILFLVCRHDIGDLLVMAQTNFFSQIITCVMVSRLVLNLRNVRDHMERTGTSGVAGNQWTREITQKRTVLDTMVGAFAEESSDNFPMGALPVTMSVGGTKYDTDDEIAIASFYPVSRGATHITHAVAI
ncbi:hypothetical protein K439DRAFT_1639172 [Ramaria rubella]|nr:hypothetical protein K439DRAFT_1639172 [Ramaria rubella]